MRHRLPKSALKKLPIHKFKEGDPFETCCICLDDFEEGDKLRILPCDHAYHSKVVYFNKRVVIHYLENKVGVVDFANAQGMVMF